MRALGEDLEMRSFERSIMLLTSIAQFRTTMFIASKSALSVSKHNSATNIAREAVVYLAATSHPKAGGISG